MGELTKARKEYERMATFPRGRQFYGHVYALSFYHLGDCYKAEGQKGKAAEYYQRFLNLWHDADLGIPELASAERKLLELKGR
jgi:hypothetical protein